jgi:hypothetical protein
LPPWPPAFPDSPHPRFNSRHEHSDAQTTGPACPSRPTQRPTCTIQLGPAVDLVASDHPDPTPATTYAACVASCTPRSPEPVKGSDNFGCPNGIPSPPQPASTPWRLPPLMIGVNTPAPLRVRHGTLITTIAAEPGSPGTLTPVAAASPPRSRGPPPRAPYASGRPLCHQTRLPPSGCQHPPPLFFGEGPTPGCPSPLTLYKQQTLLRAARCSPGSILTSNGWFSLTGPGPSVT